MDYDFRRGPCFSIYYQIVFQRSQFNMQTIMEYEEIEQVTSNQCFVVVAMIVTCLRSQRQD